MKPLLLVSVLFPLCGCTVVTDYGMATMADAGKMRYKSRHGATFDATELNHSTMGNNVVTLGTRKFTSEIWKKGIEVGGEVVGDGVVSDVINQNE